MLSDEPLNQHWAVSPSSLSRLSLHTLVHLIKKMSQQEPVATFKLVLCGDGGTVSLGQIAGLLDQQLWSVCVTLLTCAG